MQIKEQLFMCYVKIDLADAAQKMYQYSLRTFPRGLSHVGVYSMKKVMLKYTVHMSYFYVKNV